jgi:hypothetical protein
MPTHYTFMSSLEKSHRFNQNLLKDARHSASIRELKKKHCAAGLFGSWFSSVSKFHVLQQEMLKYLSYHATIKQKSLKSNSVQDIQQ